MRIWDAIAIFGGLYATHDGHKIKETLRPHGMMASINWIVIKGGAVNPTRFTEAIQGPTLDAENFLHLLSIAPPSRAKGVPDLLQLRSLVTKTCSVAAHHFQSQGFGLRGLLAADKFRESMEKLNIAQRAKLALIGSRPA